MLLALALGVLVELELVKIWDLCLIVFLSGTVMAFDIPVRQAFIVDLVGKPDLPNAIALNSTLFNATRVMGPAVGGVVIAAVGMANCFFLNAASFLAVLLALILMRLPPAQPAPWKPFLHAWKELLDYLLDRRELRLVLLLMTVVAVFAMPYYVLLPILARDTLGVGPRGFGHPHGRQRPGGLSGRPHPGPAPATPPAHALLSGGPGPVSPGADGPGALPQLLRRPGLHLPVRFRHGDPALHRQQPAAAQRAG